MPFNQELEQYDLVSNPFDSFQKWFAQAEKANLHLPEAATLSTATKAGKVSARMVLLKGLHQNGFLIFTNYESAKAGDLAENPFASLVFYWGILEKQIRLRGPVTKTTAKESQDYFQTRPRGSQISAWASAQSKTLSSRKELQNRYQEIENKFAGKEIPCPPFWGGYRLEPEEFEFWQGQSDRLHDRFHYQRKNNQWVIERLSP